MKRTSLTKRLGALAAALAFCAVLAGCGASGGNSAGATMTAEGSAAYDTAASEETGEAGTVDSAMDPAAAQTDRKIIYTASLDMESTDFDGTRTALLEAVDASGGYLASSDQYGSAEDQDRYVYYSVRVPADNYRSFLEAVGDAGNVLNLSEATDDITTQYIDVQARLTALENQRDRLNALAEKAETTADLLEIESQLSDVQYQIESYTQQQRWMDDQVSYSTVDISLREVRVLTPETPATFAEKLGRALGDGWDDFVDLLEGLVLTLAYLWPMVIVAAVIVVALIATAPARRTRREAKAARRAASRGPAGPASYTPPPAPEPKAEDAPTAPDADNGTPKY